LDPDNVMVDTMNLLMYYLYLLVMLLLDLLSLDDLLSMDDMMVDKNNPSMIVLDLTNTMLPHRNKMDREHLLERNDLQMNFDK
jgi:hypothetical protein